MSHDSANVDRGLRDLVWTEFPDLQARTCEVHEDTWPVLLKRIRDAGPYKSKASAPLLKLARFGSAETNKGCIRHDANVISISGVEGDYDGGEVTMQEACLRLERAGVRAAVYPTPSSTPDRPRWRVLCPLSAPAQPSDRKALVARLNAALGGILAPESATLSQAYYFGAIRGAAEPYDVITTFNDPMAGVCIDEARGLDAESEVPAPAASVQSGPKDISHLLYSSGVLPFPADCFPTGPGQRTDRLWVLARHVKLHRPEATPAELREIARQWHQKALPTIRSKDFDETLSDFVRAFKKVKQPRGSVMAAILERLDGTPLPPGIAALDYGDECNLLVRLCSALQAHHGAEPFFLAVRTAGKHIGVPYPRAGKMFDALVFDGVLELVKKGSGKIASRYRFVWRG